MILIIGNWAVTDRSMKTRLYMLFGPGGESWKWDPGGLTPDMVQELLPNEQWVLYRRRS